MKEYVICSNKSAKLKNTSKKNIMFNFKHYYEALMYNLKELKLK